MTGFFNLFYSKSGTLYLKTLKWDSDIDEPIDAGDGEITVSSSSNSSGEIYVAPLPLGRVVVVHKESGNTGTGEVVVRQLAGTDVTDENFIGFSSAAYSNGNTATINVVGATSTQSSLTPGQKYYVQNNGTIGLTPAVPSVYAGIAIATNNLLIKG